MTPQPESGRGTTRGFFFYPSPEIRSIYESNLGPERSYSESLATELKALSLLEIENKGDEFGAAGAAAFLNILANVYIA
jgi:hypothetical protein